MDLPHSENPPLSSTQQMMVYENLYVPRQDYGLDEGMYINLSLTQPSSSVGHSNNGVSEQRRVRCPVPCTVRYQSCMSAMCLALLCVMLLIIIGMLSVINAHLRSSRSSCFNQSAELVPTYTHLQLSNSSLTGTQ